MMSQRQFSAWQTEKVSSKEELKSFFQKQTEALPARCVFLFQGDVGVGKTESVKTLAEILGLGSVASPSFAIHHRYENSKASLDHVDLYRLTDEDDLESTGFWDLFQQEKSLIVIEWPERLSLDWLPGDWAIFEFKYSFASEKNVRQIQVRHEI